MNKIIKLSIIFLMLGIILFSGCIDSEKPSEIDGGNKPVKSDAPREWIEMGPYDSVGKPADIGGRLVFWAEKNGEQFIVDDGTEESTERFLKNVDLVDVGGKLAFKDACCIFYDGKIFGDSYDAVGVPVSVGGKLAYTARSELNIKTQYNRRKFVVVYDGEEHGTEYENALEPIDIGGKLGYHAYNVNEGIFTEYVILDGKEISVEYKGNRISEFKDIGTMYDVGGKLAFQAKIDWKFILFYDGKEIGSQYDRKGLPANIGGKLAYVAEKGDRYIIVYDGSEIGWQYDSIESLSQDKFKEEKYFLNVNNKLAYIAKKGEKEIIVFDGEEIGTQYDRVGYAVNIGGKLAYAAEKDDDVFIVYDGIEVGKQYDGISAIIDVGGKLAYKAEKDGVYFIVVEK